MAKEGSTVSGLMDTIGVLTSMALQFGVPLEVLVQKFSHVRFEPSGFTKNPEIPIAKSLIDYIFRFLGSQFLRAEQRAAVGLVERDEPAARASRRRRRPPAPGVASGSRPAPQPIGFTPSGDPAAHADRVQSAGRCAELPRLRVDHGAQRRVLQMPQLRGDERLLLSASIARMASRRRRRSPVTERAPLSCRGDDGESSANP